MYESHGSGSGLFYKNLNGFGLGDRQLLKIAPPPFELSIEIRLLFHHSLNTAVLADKVLENGIYFLRWKPSLMVHPVRKCLGRVSSLDALSHPNIRL